MLKIFLDFLNTLVGKTVVGFFIVFCLGVIAMYNLETFVVTPRVLSAEKDCITNEMAQADKKISRKADWNRLDIVDWKIKSLASEKMQLQNFIDIKQNGQPTYSQSQRIEEITNTISTLQADKKVILEQMER